VSRISRFSRPFALTPVVLLVAGFAGAHAQSNSGALRGEVRDATGAKVKGATVTLTNLGTKITKTATTNDAGIYQFSAVDPGDYKVVVAGQGFKNYEVGSTAVTLAATTTVDAMLQVGGAGETIQVTATEPLLDTASASGGQLFDKQQIQDLPNLGRNPFIFEKLDSNVTTTGDPRYVRAEDQTGLSQVSVSGAPIGANNYVVDGMPISRSDGGVTFIPSPEAVSDSKVQANAYDAEVGRTGGAVFNTSLQSGTSSYHGALYGITRQTPWAANVWYNPVNSAIGLKSPVQDDTTYQYAGAFGGPLPFMKKIKLLDNTFFYVTEEGYRQAQFYPSSSAVTRVPTAAERNGDFSADLVAGASMNGATSTGYQLYDPTSPIVGGARTNAIAGNIIPTGYISPTGKALLNAFPLPNTTGNGSNYNQLNTFKTRSDMYSGKLEHTFAPWWTAGVSFVHLATQEPSGFILGGTTVAENATKLLRDNNATAVNNTFTINPTTLLTVGYGFQRYYSASFQYSNNYNLGAGGLAFPSSFTSQLQSDTFPTTTISNVTNGRSIGGANGTVQVQSSKNIVVGLTKTLNRHNIKVGYVYRLLAFKSTPNSIPSFTFNGQYTAQSPSAPSSASPAAFADILMGLPSASAYTLQSGSFNQLANYHAFYLQDDFRLTQKLTLNMGIRYEYELGQHEQNNRFNVGFSPTVNYTIPSAVPQAVHGGLLFAGQNGAPTHCCNQSHEKISPRIGFAYVVNPKTVVHGGFGVFYAPVGLAFVAQGYSQLSNANVNGLTPTQLTAAQVGAGSGLSNPTQLYPSGFVQPSGNSLGALTGIGGSLGTLLDFGRRYPLVQQYSFDVQQDLPWGINFKLSYVGAHSRNIIQNANINQISSAQLAADRTAGVKLSASTANPYYFKPGTTINGYAPTGNATSATTPLAQLQLPFPQFTSITVAQDSGYSRYNALAVKVQKRVTNGLTVLTTYTWSANWDNLWGAGSQVYTTYGPQDAFNPKAEYARALNNVPNRFTAAFSYDLPIGRGKKLLGAAPWYVDELVGGWQINDEWTMQNGVPLSVNQTNLNLGLGTTGFGGTYQRPNLVGDAHSACLTGRPQGRLGVSSSSNERAYVNVAAFAPAAAYTYGNAPRSLPCQQPGSNNSDISINKNFKITERVNAQFRAEALNAFNTPQFGNPSATYVVGTPATVGATPVAATGSSQTLGNVTTQINYNRIIQLGGRISF
jgi:hypothetical protein